jgi:hypothetical protein
LAPAETEAKEPDAYPEKPSNNFGKNVNRSF